jgi:RNA polymerase sigma-70 factor (ECF subfamily)
VFPAGERRAAPGQDDRETTQYLVAKAQRGDRPAFCQLVERYRQRLECLIHLRLGRKLRRRVEVADVLQESLLKAHISLRSFRWKGESSFIHWLQGIAEHVIKDLVRQHIKAGKRSLGREIPWSALQAMDGKLVKAASPFPAAQLSPSEVFRRNECFDRLEKALLALNASRRQVILLALVQNLPMKDIAVRMSRSPDAVSMLLLRALRQMRLLLGNTESFHLPKHCRLELPEEERPPAP